MKSAYELAMERLNRDQGATKKLSDEQKASIADIEKKFAAKIAETRLSYDAKISQAGTMEELSALQGACAEAIASFEAQRDRDKDAIWNES